MFLPFHLLCEAMLPEAFAGPPEKLGITCNHHDASALRHFDSNQIIETHRATGDHWTTHTIANLLLSYTGMLCGLVHLSADRKLNER